MKSVIFIVARAYSEEKVEAVAFIVVSTLDSLNRQSTLLKRNKQLANKMSTEFVFIRHAQATHNVDAEQRGPVAYNDPIHTDAALTDTGYEQANNTVVDGSFAAVYCSPLRRCRQTLLTIHPPFCNESVQLDDRLMEPNGHICNRRAERLEVLADIPVNWDAWGVAAANPWTPDEESLTDFHGRIRAFTADMLRRHVGERILIVSHFQWIAAWFHLFKGRFVAPNNCQVLTATL